MLLVPAAIVISVFAYVLACRYGVMRYRLSFRTRLEPAAAYSKIAELDASINTVTGSTWSSSLDDRELEQLRSRDGILLAQKKRIDVDVPHSSAFWEQLFTAGNRPSSWFWSYTTVSPNRKGAQVGVTMGPGAPLSLYLIMLLFAVPRYWLAMRKESRKSRGASTLLDDLHPDLMTSLIAGASFLAIWGVEAGLILIPVILLHEYGHVLGYQLTGKTGNRMMLVPFFGGIAIAGSQHKSEAERAFCAIMGPAICVPVSILLAVVYAWTDGELSYWAYYAAWICAFINALNLLPALPLDGGHTLESILRSISPSQAGYAMLALTAAIAAMLFSRGYEVFAFIIVLWALPNISRSISDKVSLSPMGMSSGLTISAFYLLTAALHVAVLLYLTPAG